jgi:hypothetical protein
MQRRTIVAIWLVAAAVSLVIAWLTAVGPVVLVLQRGHHGVHVGDLVGLGACSSWAVHRTRQVLRRDRPREPAASGDRTSDG